MWRLAQTSIGKTRYPGWREYLYDVEFPLGNGLRINALGEELARHGLGRVMSTKTSSVAGGHVQCSVTINSRCPKKDVDLAMDSWLNCLSYIQRIDNSVSSAQPVYTALAGEQLGHSFLESLHASLEGEIRLLSELLNRADVMPHEEYEYKERLSLILAKLARLNEAMGKPA